MNFEISRFVCRLSFWVCTYLGLLSLLEESLSGGLLLGLLSGEVLGLRDLLDLGSVQAGDVDLV